MDAVCASSWLVRGGPQSVEAGLYRKPILPQSRKRGEKLTSSNHIKRSACSQLDVRQCGRSKQASKHSRTHST